MCVLGAERASVGCCMCVTVALMLLLVLMLWCVVLVVCLVSCCVELEVGDQLGYVPSRL